MYAYYIIYQPKSYRWKASKGRGRWKNEIEHAHTALYPKLRWSSNNFLKWMSMHHANKPNNNCKLYIFIAFFTFILALSAISPYLSVRYSHFERCFPGVFWWFMHKMDCKAAHFPISTYVMYLLVLLLLLLLVQLGFYVKIFKYLITIENSITRLCIISMRKLFGFCWSLCLSSFSWVLYVHLIFFKIYFVCTFCVVVVVS